MPRCLISEPHLNAECLFRCNHENEGWLNNASDWKDPLKLIIMILMTSNSAVSVIPECKGNYGSAKYYYYYLILVTRWGWDLASTSPIWPREEWGLPPSLHPLQAWEGRTVQAGWRQDSAPSFSCVNLGSYFVVSGGGSFARAANWEKGEMAPYHPSCLHLGSRGSKRATSLCPLLVLLVFP